VPRALSADIIATGHTRAPLEGLWIGERIGWNDDVVFGGAVLTQSDR